MTGTTYDGLLTLRVRGRQWRRTQRPPLSLTVLERPDHLLVLPSDQSGGLRGGDQTATVLEVTGEGAVVWNPPTSSLYFPSADRTGVCRASVTVAVEPGSRAWWVPPVSIPCAQARIEQTVEVWAAPGAELLYWDGWADGRTASGERSRFSRLANRLEFRWNDRVLFRECWSLGPEAPSSSDPAGLQGACQWHLGLAAGPRSIEALVTRVRLWKQRGQVAEVDELAEGVYLARVLTRVAHGTGPIGAEISGNPYS